MLPVNKYYLALRLTLLLRLNLAKGFASDFGKERKDNRLLTLNSSSSHVRCVVLQAKH